MNSIRLPRACGNLEWNSHLKESYMSSASRWFAGVLALVFLGASGCAHHHSVKLEQVPDAARAVIQTHTAGAEICRIKQKQKDGQTVYKVKYKKDGREHELKVSAAGDLLELEEKVTLDELPAAVRATVEEETAGGEIKKLEKETEGGKTFYEVKFKKDGKKHEVEINPDGSVLKRETE